ncbi:Hypothetical protein NCS54_00321300 [Fusarium falciforme]|uniref:Hypothetical protein n=1 Tax=Fusarium falciforme TaxID=195108 RepID=UPI0023011FBB|nr:Hypothetical protein NCS54_00321300 [Fusarium falciforme]WAO85959.1 Hypothetical protein NCS54_00321300 [Fusarium falciforme]
MKFSSVLYLALPALSLARPSGPCVAATPTPEADLPTCEEVAGSYARYCDRCEHLCADSRQDSKTYEMCINSVFFQANSWDSQCWQHGGFDCGPRSIDKVCGPAK